MSTAFRYSALDTAHRCMQKYKFQYVDQLHVEGLDSLDLHFGTAMHTGIQACLEGDDPLGVFSVYWDSIEGQELATSKFTWPQLKDMGEVLLTRFQRLHSKHFEIFKMEERVSGKFADHVIEGTPDFIGIYKGKKSVVDFKTSNYEYTKERVIINEQMPIYAELARQNYGYEAEQIVYVVFVKSQMRIQVITLDLTKEFLQDKINNVIIMCDDLSKRVVFPKNPGSCMMGKFKCPYFDTCHGSKK